MTTSLDARIGTLCRNGQTVFYAYVGGRYDETGYVESTDAAAVLDKLTGVKAPAPAAKKVTYKRYAVTVTPTTKVYCGNWTNGAYTVEVRATDRNDAIKQARREYRDNEGSDAVPAIFRAVRVQDEQ